MSLNHPLTHHHLLKLLLLSNRRDHLNASTTSQAAVIQDYMINSQEILPL